MMTLRTRNFLMFLKYKTNISNEIADLDKVDYSSEKWLPMNTKSPSTRSEKWRICFCSIISYYDVMDFLRISNKPQKLLRFEFFLL